MTARRCRSNAPTAYPHADLRHARDRRAQPWTPAIHEKNNILTFARFDLSIVIKPHTATRGWTDDACLERMCLPKARGTRATTARGIGATGGACPPGNPYDGHLPAWSLAHTRLNTGVLIETAVVNCRGPRVAYPASRPRHTIGGQE
jgi:hypothetical protein